MAGDLDIVGGAAVDVVPIVPNFHNKLKAAVLPIADQVGAEAGRKMGEKMGDAMRAALTGDAQRIGNDLGDAIGDAMARRIVAAIPTAINQGGRAGARAAGRQGDDAGGAFARSMRRKLEAAFKAMPKLDVRLGDTGVDAELARIRAKLEALSNKRIGIDVTTEAAEAEVARLDEQLRRLGASHPNIAVRADTAAARAALAEMREEIAVLTADPARIRIETDGALGARLRAAVQAAEASLPNINIDADTSPAQAEIASLRARLTALRDVKIGVDISADDALAQVREIQLKLRELSAQRAQVDVDTGRARVAITNLNLLIDRLRGRTPTVDVRVDAGQAEAELAAVHRQVNNLDRDDVRIRVHANTAQANAALLQLAVSLGAVAAIPLIPIIGAGLGAITSAAVTAVAGVGAVALAAVPAVLGVTKVIQAKSAAEKEAASATNNSAAASVKASQSALQMATAQQSLTSAHRNAARSIAQANRQVEDAERAVAQAAQRAADQRRQAAENIERAERSLVDAKRDARQAEQDLTQARADAANQLRELNERLEDGALDERDATLRVREAHEDLQRVLADPRASELQQQRAQLSYDQAVQAAEQQKSDYADLQKEAEKQRKAGVDGNADVKRAADQLSTAQQNVRDQTEAVADAHREAARTQIEAAQTVADAQRNLSDAVTNAADAQVQAAESIASAERGVESARLSSIDTTSTATTKTDEYRKALAKLTPEQRDLFESIAGPKGLTKAFKDWSKELQPDVLPLFTRGVDGAKNTLPGLSPLVRNSADAIGELMDRASAQLKTPFWQGFKKDIAENAKPAIVGLGVSFGNIFKGMAGIVDAFLPHMDSISERMQDITGRFADWGSGLKGSPEFEGFLAYASEVGPGVADFFGQLGDAFYDVAKAMEPLSGVILEVVGTALELISDVAENAPWAIQLMYGLWIATRLVNLAFASSPIGLVILGLLALGVAIKLAWDHFEWFRDGVRGAWEGIQTAAKFAWEQVLRPAFFGIRDGILAVGDAAVWLWKNIFDPVFRGIWFVARLMFAIVVTAVLTPLVLVIQGVGLVALWLWTDCFKPTFDGIAWLAQWVWTAILQPTFQGIWDAIKWLGEGFVWLYDHAVRPSMNWIADKASWLWEKALRPAFRWIWDGLKWLGDRFRWLYDHGVKPPMDWIADKADWLYRRGIKPAFDRMKSAVKLVGDAFETAKDAIGKSWDKVSDIAKKPVNFIIKWVYTKGIKAVWDRVAGFVGLSKLPEAPKLLEAGGTVGNGWGPARPMKTNRPTAIVGEGNSNYPEYVIPTDPKYRSRAVALHQAAGSQLLAKGGVLGDIDGAWDWTKDTVSDVIGTGIDWAKTGADLVSNPSKIWDKLTKPVLDKVGDGVRVAGKWGAAVGKFPLKMATGLKDKIVNAVSSMFAGGGGGGAWLKPVNVPYGTPFGKAGSMWSSGRHTGLDFPAPTGTPVKAVADGQVSVATSGGPYGKHIVMNHGGGLQSLYAHLSRIRTTVPKAQNAGSRIGDVGATGNTTGPHLHLEARLNGKPVDPMKYLSGGGGFSAQAVGAAQNYAKSILGNYGWGSSQFGPLKKLWDGESGWRWNADNPTSDAYGIPQALPGSKMASAGSDWRTNYKTQVRWGLGYIKGRPDYGSPAAAYSKWLSRSPHWYDNGGMLQPGLNLVANGTGKPEPVLTSGQWADVRAAKNGPTELHADVRVYVGDREITDIVDTRIELRESSTATAINDGRWV
ncbi:peptidoglycan DD-metalloendopeptidase family protein [Streptomyces umbrinus]|uniref:aggregation-promoting factor C-terminal-like domain-containing protein n=1 Tax=Streptomyces umbrinus TaxID=67370 RepID=UPI003413F2D0